MKQIFILVIIFISTSLTAQFGLRAKFNKNNYKDWTESLNDYDANDAFTSSWEVGLDYWFRLKNKRIEFYPEIAYSQSKTAQDKLPLGDMSMKSYKFNMNVNIYPLDFTGDCDCPTFSKQGPGLQKGFFVFIAPGVSYDAYDHGGQLESNNINYKIGGGIGLDIGINDLITITPFVGYHRSLNTDWENFDCGLSPIIDNCSQTRKTSLGQIQAGLRIGFRPDYKR